MDLATVRTRLAALVDDVTGLRVRDDLVDSIDPPAAVIGLLAPLEFDADFDGHATARWFIRLFVQRSRTGLAALDGYLSPTGIASVKVAVDADSDLGGAVASCRVVSVADYGAITVGEVEYLSGLLEVETIG